MYREGMGDVVAIATNVVVALMIEALLSRMSVH